MRFVNVTIPCKTCGTRFLPKSPKNVFCTRKCFKKNFYHRKKLEDLNAKKFPSFVCPNCGKKIDLEFDPLLDELKWAHYECPFCRTLLINVCEYINTQDESIQN